MTENDETYEPTPADFDLSAWVRGVHRNVKTVPFYAAPHLEDEIALLRERLSQMRDDGAERGLGDESPASLRAQIDELSRELEASRVDFKVEARSTSHRKATAERLKAEGVAEDSEDFTLGLLAEQIVQPTGVTAADLAVLANASEPQVRLLLDAVAEVNYKAPRVDPPFSPASFAGRTRLRS